MNPNGRPKLKRKHIPRIEGALRRHCLSLNKAAKLLNINRQTLTNWIKLGVPENEVLRVLELVGKAESELIGKP